IIAGETPIALGIEIAEEELFLQRFLDARRGASDLARDEGLAAPRALMVEENAVADEEPIGFAIIHRIPMRRDLAYSIRAAGIERRRFALRRLRHPEHFRRARLIEARLAATDRRVIAQRFEQAQGAYGDRLAGIFRHLERDHHVALRAEIVDLVGFDLLKDAAQRRAVGQIAVVQRKISAADVRIVIKMIDAIGVEEA